MHDGSAGGEGIGGGAGRGGHDQTVGAVAADKIGVNGEFELDHAGERAFVDHHFVQDALIINYFARAFELHAHHDAFAHRKTALHGVVQRSAQLVHSETPNE